MYRGGIVLLNVDKKSKTPMYAQLFDIILQKITSGELIEGGKLPFERELCDEYNISRTTVRQAMDELEKKGYINKIRGKGIYVSSQTYMQSLVSVYSFHEEMEKQGKKTSIDVISFATILPSPKVSQKLNTEEEVYEIIRIRFANGEPILHETTYLPKYLFPDLKKKELKELGLYEVFRKKYNKYIQNAFDTFRAVNVEQNVARYLHEKEGAPALQIERLAYCNNQPIEYTIEIARGTKFAYTVELNNKSNISATND